ncbi:hypothetical protein EMCG_07384 [[Emmonsia] crescens]|uniref:Uncharacterized protein n=1 Tax=[Emmonsia] crescens TaxID=73230 RepID=A0A0G2I8R4_9EURO|nr:hypothetical protein EMCG_07384 [Emmonsia crescens UAMH 3008]
MATMTSFAAVPTGSAICGTLAHCNIPTNDASCAVPNKGENKYFMKDCCKGASVNLFNNNYAFYCLADDQTIEDLINCLFEAGVVYHEIWCNQPENSTATGTSPMHTSASFTHTSASPTHTSADLEPTSTEIPGTATSLYMPIHVQSGPTKLGLAVCFVMIPALIGGIMF